MATPPPPSQTSSKVRLSCLFPHKHSERRVAERTEQLEITQDEISLIRSLPTGPVSITTSPSLSGPLKVLLDTDLGTDADDALALLYALRLPDFHLLGVTTNYGVSAIRAALARQIISLHRQCRAGYPDVPVVAGSSRPMGSHRDCWITGVEGVPLLPQEFLERNSVHAMNQIEQLEGADFIAAVVNANPGEVTICSIGIPTNIGLALKRHTGLSEKVREIIVMGTGLILADDRKIDTPFQLPQLGSEVQFARAGRIVHLMTSHNLGGDVEASRILFNESRCPIRVVPSSITRQFKLKGAAIRHLEANAGQESPSGVVGTLMRKWFEIRQKFGAQTPHDPVVIHEARFRGDEGAVRYIPGRIVVHEWAAFGTFVPHHDGPHLLGVAVNRDIDFIGQLTQVLTEKD